MEPKYNIFCFLSCTFFLIFLLNLFPTLTNVEAHPPHQQDTKTPQTLDYLKTLVGTRKGNSAKGLSHLKKYLSNLGYMNVEGITKPPLETDLFDETLELAVRAYQAFFKLEVTDVLDANTVKQISQPRCGVPDNFSVLNKTQLQGKTPTISSRYTFFPGRPAWPAGKRSLTYSFPPGYSNDVFQAMVGATDIWGAYSPFVFTFIDDYDKADVKISFQVRDHGDGAPFDGAGGVLAHAFAPSDGRLHFDGDEQWVNGVVDGALDLQTVGLHEMGHILGLGHTGDGGAIMWPYIGYASRKGIDDDDIAGIRDLYPS